jgi:hypothetical protein
MKIVLARINKSALLTSNSIKAGIKAGQIRKLETRHGEGVYWVIGLACAFTVSEVTILRELPNET